MKTFLLCALLAGSIGAWGQVLFSADCTASAKLSVDASGNQSMSNYATITGGTMTAINGETSAKEMIQKQGTYWMFLTSANATAYKIELTNAIAVGDVISANTYSRNNADLAIWVTTANTRPSSCSTQLTLAQVETATYEPFNSYTVKTGDNLVGAKTIYIYRGVNKSVYFDEFTITRPVSVTYNGNGNDGGSVPTDAKSYLPGASVTVLGNTGSLTKAGYVFDGWNTTAEGDGIDRAAGSTFNISANTTLYAKWTGATAPTISNQPSSGTYIKDAIVNLSVVASPSTGSCNYQWYSTDATKSSSTELVGETGASLSVSTATPGNYYYYCTVGDGGANTIDTEVARVRVSPNATLSTWDFASITADDVKYNTVFWTEQSVNRQYNHSLVASTDTKLEDNFGNDLLNGIRVRRDGKTVTASLYIGDGVFVAGDDANPSKFIIPVTENKYYKVTYSSSAANKTTGFEIISGASLYKGDLTHAFTSRWSEHCYFVVKATSTSMTIKNTGYSAVRKIEEVEPDPAVTSVTPNGGAVNGGTSVAIVCDGTSHYLWSESSSATIGVGDWATGTSATVPNVAGTRYLHVYASNSTENSAITTKEFTITRQANAVIKQWDFTQELSATDLENIEADGTNWNDPIDQSSNGIRYTNKTAMSGTIKANGNNLAVLNGIQVYSKDNENISVGNLRINSGSYVQINGAGTYKIQSLENGDKVAITYISAKTDATSERSWSITSSNATKTSANGTETIDGYADNTPKTVEYTMSAAGDLKVKQSGGLNVKRITVSRTVSVETVTKRNDRTYGTYVTANQLDFTNVSGMEAYIATGLNAGKTSVTLQKVTKVPAGTPIILKTDEQTTASADVPVTTTATANDVAGNTLVAGDGSTAWDGTVGYTYYYIASDQFHKAISGTLQSGKAYLKVANDPNTARSLSIAFADETTGISASLMNNEEIRMNGDFYDLQGRRVAVPTKGLYIVNGKKVIIK